MTSGLPALGLLIRGGTRSCSPSSPARPGDSGAAAPTPVGNTGGMTLRQSFYRLHPFDDRGFDRAPSRPTWDPSWDPHPAVRPTAALVKTLPRRRAIAPQPSLWTPLSFGKHGGKTLPQVLFADPDYYFWAHEEDAFSCQDTDIGSEVERIYRRATAIRPPRIEGKSEYIEYLTQDGTFAGIQLAPAGTTSGAATLDMSFPRSLKDYDKTGNKILVRDMKAIWFWDASRRMNRRRCEAFFNEVRWFLNP
jgi:hypothetical protein